MHQGRANTLLTPAILATMLAVSPAISLALPAHADTASLPARLSVRMLLKALSYDQNLVQRSGQAVRIGVLVQPDSARSVTDGDAFLGELQEILGKSSMQGFVRSSTQGLPVSTVRLEMGPDARLEDQLREQNINVVYLSTGWSRVEVERIVASAERQGLLVMAGDPEQIQAGAALGAFQLDGKPRFMVHVPGAMRQGARFDSGLLRLATLVR